MFARRNTINAVVLTAAGSSVVGGNCYFMRRVQQWAPLRLMPGDGPLRLNRGELDVAALESAYDSVQ